MRAMRKIQPMLIAVLLGGVTAGVISGVFAISGCGPSIDPALKADIDRRNSTLGAPTQSFPGPTGFAPMPLQVGQWTQHRMVRDQEPAFLTYKVVGQISNAFWVESVYEGYA